VWDAATGAILSTLSGHSDIVMSVSFSPDGKRVLTGSRDQTARLWDVASGRELLSLKGHRGWVVTVAFSRDGQRIVTASSDGTAKVWQADSAEEVKNWQSEERWAAEAQSREQAAEAAAATEQARASRMKMPGEINRWLVLLPIPFEGIGGADALQVAEGARERQLRPRVGDKIKVGKSALVWRQSEDYLLDFNQIVGRETQFSVAYAVCYLESPTTQTNLVLKVGSSDQAKIFLNEREIYRITNPQSWKPDRDTVAGVGLKAGVNVLVFKVVNERTDWGGSVRITDAAGQVVKGLRVTVDPGTRN
jgi:hypothetical protein